MAYEFVGTCEHLPGHEITQMIDAARQITYRTFIGKLDAETRREMQSRRNPRLKDDWSVRFYKSKWRGKPCVFMEHSAIEHIYVKST